MPIERAGEVEWSGNEKATLEELRLELERIPTPECLEDVASREFGDSVLVEFLFTAHSSSKALRYLMLIA